MRAARLGQAKRFRLVGGKPPGHMHGNEAAADGGTEKSGGTACIATTRCRWRKASRASGLATAETRQGRPRQRVGFCSDSRTRARAARCAIQVLAVATRHARRLALAVCRMPYAWGQRLWCGTARRGVERGAACVAEAGRAP